jgi:ATP-dependent helicase/DNAse subunit B
MAEHLRNELAREGFIFRPGVVTTFSKFVESLVAPDAVVRTPALELMLKDILKFVPLGPYAGLREYTGFRRCIVSAVEELASAGASLQDLRNAGVAEDFQTIYEAVEARLKLRGWQFRSTYLKALAERIRDNGVPDVGTLCFAGFYSFTPPELDVVRALSRHASLIVGVPDWPGSASTLRILRSCAAEEHKLHARESKVQPVVVPAPTIEAEVADIARRMLASRRNGRKWREMGVIVRSEEPYAPVLRSAFDRFGIPSRFYFGERLIHHVTVRFLTAVIDAALGGWDHALTLSALRMPGSPLERTSEGDAFEYRVRERLPGSGLEALRNVAPASARSTFEQLEALDRWRAGDAPIASWTERFSSLRTLVSTPEIRDRLPHETAFLPRAEAAALNAFEAAVADTGAALDSTRRYSCREFRDALCAVLDTATLRVPDHRRDVVHVIDGFEARQWRLPLVFIPGLLEKQFPRYHSEDPILPDAVRRRLQTAGLPLRTSTERQSDEGFLFGMALSRATDAVTLSYPKLNAKGEPNLASFFLARVGAHRVDAALEARPHPVRRRAPEPHATIYDEPLRAELARRHARIRATAIESYLQCPYRFFAEYTLKLKDPPLHPADRLNPMVQGSIVHSVLERASKEKKRVAEVFDEVFHDHCLEDGIPPGYRTEAVRLDLLHNLEMLESDERLFSGAESFYEQTFELPLPDGLTTITGKIDRLEVDAGGNATVIDYKYKGKLGIDKTVRGHEEETHIQGGLYLLALSALGDYEPGGMVYCGFKREVSFGGWVLAPRCYSLGAEAPPERLREVMQQARELAATVAANIRQGGIEPRPADEKKCEYCSYANSCRVDVAAIRRISEAAGQ